MRVRVLTSCQAGYKPGSSRPKSCCTLSGVAHPEEVMFNILRLDQHRWPAANQSGIAACADSGAGAGFAAGPCPITRIPERHPAFVSPARMSDREMVLRFIAFRLTGPDKY